MKTYKLLLLSFLLILSSNFLQADENNNVILYGTDFMSVGENTLITGGDIGSGGEVFIGESGEIYGDLFSSGLLRFSAYVYVEGMVFAGGRVQMAPGVVINENLIRHPDAVPDVSIPFQEGESGEDDITVYELDSDILSPGSYGEVFVEAGGTLELTGGTYSFLSLTLDDEARLEINDPTVITLEENFDFGRRSRVILDNNMDVTEFEIYSASENPSRLRNLSEFHGIIYHPYGKLNLGTRAGTLEGAFFAKEVILARGTQLSGIAPCLPETEMCGDEIDQDCDGSDLDCDDSDDDGDGYTENDGDCDDENASVNPGALEVCDQLDNDCNGDIDDEDSNLDTSTLITWYEDNDGDGYGTSNSSIIACVQPDGYANNTNDCNDNLSVAYTGAVEICDGEDNDCNGDTDEGFDAATECVDGVAIPSNPEDVAPEIRGSTPTTIAQSLEFIYDGENPLQINVEEEAIEPEHVALVSGTVQDTDGNDIIGVRVTIQDHEEWGQTATRSDGEYDFVVNGGTGWLTVVYERSGYLTVHRKVQANRQSINQLDNVVLTELDTESTAVDVSGNSTSMAVHQASQETDEDGDRQVTLFFPPGLTATATLPDGSTQVLSTATVRATEYTVGDTGREAMPATLPPTSAYTYAVELSVDEAMDLDATRVDFNTPVIFYMENFLDFNVGSNIPTGYYDREIAAWVPSPDGQVVKILGDLDADGLSEIDLDGDDIQESATTLTNEGFTTEELENLNQLYTSGQTVWRVLIPHFTPWDHNYPTIFPQGARVPPKPITEEEVFDQPLDEPCNTGGSIIECENQSVGQVFALSGTPITLNYKSRKTPGYLNGYSKTITLTDDEVPENLENIQLMIWAGSSYEAITYLPEEIEPNMTYTFVWDGLDRWGRRGSGEQIFSARLAYNYTAVYAESRDEFYNSFGQFGSDVEYTREIRSNRDRDASVGLINSSQSTIGSETDTPGLGFGGWSVGIHHTYDIQQQKLHLGTGETRSEEGSRFYASQTNRQVVKLAAGLSSSGYSGDGGSALEAEFTSPYNIAFDHEGNYYIADTWNHRVRKVDTEGTITTIAGNGNTAGLSGDGGLAVNARLANPGGIAIDYQGNIYITEIAYNVIRKIDADGVISTFAGTASVNGSFSGDNGPATLAHLNRPTDLALDLDGNLYLSDSHNHVIRKIDRAGIITTIVGTGGTSGDSGDGGSAVDALLDVPGGIDLDDQGNLYIADTNNHKIRKVTAQGIIETFAGTGVAGTARDGSLATAATLNEPADVVVDSFGNVFIADTKNYAIRKVNAKGIIVRVAGSRTLPRFRFGWWALSNPFSEIWGMAMDPYGQLYFCEPQENRINRLAYSFPGFESNDLYIASKDGSQLYQFYSNGLHHETVNALTGETIFSFSYDSQNRLTGITDGDGLVTTITRDSDGLPTQIEGPFGQTYELSFNTDGYLETLTDPQNQTTTFGYQDENGLLVSVTDPESNQKTYAYGAQTGQAETITDANLASKTLASEANDTGRTVTLTSAQGVGREYIIATDDSGTRTRTFVDGSGLSTIVIENSDETETREEPSGNIIEIERASDPRFDTHSSYISNYTLTTPSQLVYEVAVTKNATLNDTTNLLSHVQLTNEISVNSRVTTQNYNRLARRWTNTSPEGRVAYQWIDTQGRTIRNQVGSLEGVSYSYDRQGLMETMTIGSTTPRIYEYEYYSQEDSAEQPYAGLLKSVTNPLGQITEYEYDLAGRVTKTILPDSSEINFTYDGTDNLETLISPEATLHSFTYTSTNLEESYIAPDISLTNHNINYTYNNDHQVRLVERPDGSSVIYSYDTAGRLDEVNFSQGDYGFAYNSSTGQLETLTSPDVDLDYEYDGHLLTSMEWSGTDINGSVEFTYDNNFWLDVQTINGTSDIDYDYDDDGLIVNAGDLNLSHNTSGFLETSHLDQIEISYAYNVLGELENKTIEAVGNPLYQADYTRDSLGRIHTLTYQINGTSTLYEYDYDDVGRLETVTKDGTPKTYVYDNNGNRTSDGTSSATYDDQDRLLTYGSNTYTYTDAGELESKTDASGVTTNYEYDEFGNLISVSSDDGSLDIEYLIDGQNRRVGKRKDGLVTGYLYQDQLNIVATLDSNGQIDSRFVYAEKAHVPSYMIQSGITYKIISDHLGSVRLVVRADDGTVMQEIDYDEYGVILNDSNPGFQPFGYAGGLYDSDTGLVRFGARDYDPEVGRWTLKDPIRFDGGDVNLYGYVGGDPVDYMDPEGKSPMALIYLYGGYKLMRHLTDDSTTGRKLGLEVTEKFNQGTLGYLVNKAVASVYPFVDEIASGNIGIHYSDPYVQSLMALPDTDKNIKMFAENETRWWEQQDGLPGLIGGNTPAEWRADYLKKIRNSLNPENKGPKECSSKN